MHAVIWLEGVNFAAHLDDTNDLSTRRGASLAYLHAPEFIEQFLKDKGFTIERLIMGASKGAWSLERDGGAPNDDALEKLAGEILKQLSDTGRDAEVVWKNAKKAYDACHKSEDCNYPAPAPFAHLSFTCGWGRADNLKEALAQAEARARAKQFRQFTLRPAGEPSTVIFESEEAEAKGETKAKKEAKAKEAIDVLNGVLPATIKGDLPGDTDEERKRKVSPSTKARRGYGRYARPGFYAGEAGSEWGKLYFVDHFKQMIKKAPEDIAESAKSKIAVFYADGNNFMDLAGDTPESRKAFSEHLRKLQRENLLRPILQDFKRLKENHPDLVSVPDEDNPEIRRLRFETLLWGGDELLFVMPSWLGLWFARRFFELTRDWRSPDGEPLTFGAGLLICNYKTPIRVAQKLVKNELAEKAAEWGKRQKPCQSALCAFVMESIEPMEEGLLQMRTRQLGLTDKLEDALVIPAAKFDTALERAQKLKEKFPPSQLYRLLRFARKNNLFTEGRSQEVANKLESWLQGAGAQSGLEKEDFFLVDENDCCELGKRLPMNLLWLAELWDYLPPEGLEQNAEREAAENAA